MNQASSPITLFLDTEFTGLHQETTLISLGIVSSHHDIFYAEFTDYDASQIDAWLQTNVLDALTLDPDTFVRYKYDQMDTSIDSREVFVTRLSGTQETVLPFLREWLTSVYRQQERPMRVVSDCLAYDWVLFNQLFGHAFNLPKELFYIPVDLSTMLAMHMGDSDVSRSDYAGVVESTGNVHNAAHDAMLIRACYERILQEGGDKYAL